MEPLVNLHSDSAAVTDADEEVHTIQAVLQPHRGPGR